MRVNVNDPRCRFWIRKLRVFVNGLDVTGRCYEFDTDAGYACCYVRGEKGIIVQHGDARREVLRGHVVAAPRAFVESLN